MAAKTMYIIVILPLFYKIMMFMFRRDIQGKHKTNISVSNLY